MRVKDCIRVGLANKVMVNEMDEEEENELKQYVEDLGWDVFDTISLDEDEEIVITSKDGKGAYFKGAGKLYITYIPKSENE